MFLGLIIWPCVNNFCALSWGVVPLLLSALLYIFNSLWKTRASWTFHIQFGMFLMSSLFSSYLVNNVGDTLHVFLLKLPRGKISQQTLRSYGSHNLFTRISRNVSWALGIGVLCWRIPWTPELDMQFLAHNDSHKSYGIHHEDVICQKDKNVLYLKHPFG